MSRIKKHQPIEIEWLDSGGETGIWDFQDEYTYEPHIMKTIGYFLGYHDNYLYVCQSINPDQYGRKFRIPRGCITKVTPYV